MNWSLVGSSLLFPYDLKIFCVLVTHQVNKDFIPIGVVIWHVVLRVIGLMKRRNARNCIVKQSKPFQVAPTFCEKLFPCPQLQISWGTRDMAQQKVWVQCQRNPSALDTPRDFDNWLCSPFVRRKVVKSLLRLKISLRFTLGCKINEEYNLHHWIPVPGRVPGTQ